MRLVILEAESLGKDMDLSGFSRFGEVPLYLQERDYGLSRLQKHD